MVYLSKWSRKLGDLSKEFWWLLEFIGERDFIREKWWWFCWNGWVIEDYWNQIYILFRFGEMEADTKTIKLNTGTLIHKIAVNEFEERWDVESKSLSTTHITIDLSQCSGVEVEGHEGKKEVTESINAMETKSLFVFKLTPPFVLQVGFSVKEEPIPVVNQEKYIRGAIKNTKSKISKMWKDIAKIPFEVMDPEDLAKEISKLGHDHFLDPSFPPDDSSIYDVTNEPTYPLEERPVWKRPTEFMDDTPQLFEGEICPNDIVQGALGDCWFLASIASLAENRALVKRLFISESYNEFGIYKLRICKNGEWVIVTIDDYFPCYLNGGPMFTSSRGNELWVLLLEKAYAKLHGNYCQLRAGFVAHGMMDLAGWPTFKYNFPEDKNDMNKIRKYADDLWRAMADADKRGHNMCAGTPGVDIFTEGGGPKEDHGIVPGHAYSIIQAKEYKNIRLLNVRNPWGEFEWGGAWSDNDSHWTDEMIQAFNPSFDSDDGAFWMSYEDFFMNFDSLTICKTQNWNELRLKGKFIRVQESQNPSNDWVISQFYYSFHLDKRTHIEIGLHQEDQRILGAERRPYLDLSLVILKRSGNI